jgi:1,4-alpha-glucan branching enzyme
MSDEGELLVVINYTPVYYPDYRLGVPFAGRWSELLSSDDLAYGGGGVTHPDGIVSEPIPAGRWENSVSLRLAPHGALIFKLDEKISDTAPKAKKPSARQKKNNK